jgi:hypothetical protein
MGCLAASNSYISQSPYMEAGKTYTLSFYARGVTTSASGILSLFDSGLNYSSVNFNATTAAWQRFSVTLTPTVTGYGSFYIGMNYSGVGQNMYVDAIMLTQSNYAIPYSETILDSSRTQFTASSTTSQTGYGQYGDGVILYTPSFYNKSAAAYSAVVGPAVSSDVIKVFMTDFSYNIKKRYELTDIVDMDIKFTEI